MTEYFSRFLKGRFAITGVKDKAHIHYIHANRHFASTSYQIQIRTDDDTLPYQAC
jgi:hypothetical protein